MLTIGRIEIPKRSGSCQICGRSFSGGDLLISRLFPSSAGALVRVDSCASCGLGEERPSLSSWRSTMPDAKKASMGSKERDAAARDLFERLQSNFSGKEASLYLLALYLERRKVLVRRGEVESEGGSFFLFEMHSSGEVYSIPKVDAGVIDLALIDEEIKAIIGL